MSVDCADNILSDFNVSKRGVKRPKTIGTLDDAAPQNGRKNSKEFLSYPLK